MPVLIIQTNAPLRGAQVEGLLGELAQNLAPQLGKMPNAVMASLVRCDMAVAGSSAPAALFDIQSIGALEPEQKALICHGLHETLARHAAIAPERMFFNFCDISPGDAWKIRGGQPVCLDKTPLLN
jgi:hypothetical protein